MDASHPMLADVRVEAATLAGRRHQSAKCVKSELCHRQIHRRVAEMKTNRTVVGVDTAPSGCSNSTLDRYGPIRARSVDLAA